MDARYVLCATHAVFIRRIEASGAIFARVSSVFADLIIIYSIINHSN